MRRLMGFALTVLLIALLLLSGLASASPSIAFTPTALAYLPLIVKQPTPTPTFTPTPLPTATPNPCSRNPDIVSGQLAMKENKPSYAAGIENIFFIETIFNNSPTPICYGILGVQPVPQVGGAPQNFHTSWSGDLQIDPFCTGPRDRCGGAWEDSLIINEPGTYRLYLSICYSTVDVCPSAGVWRILSSNNVITVINWTPDQPQRAPSRADPLAGCRLEVGDPDHLHMLCDRTS